MKAGKGFLTVACNNYLPYAFKLAESIKATQRDSNISVIVDDLGVGGAAHTEITLRNSPCHLGGRHFALLHGFGHGNHRRRHDVLPSNRRQIQIDQGPKRRERCAFVGCEVREVRLAFVEPCKREPTVGAADSSNQSRGHVRDQFSLS